VWARGHPAGERIRSAAFRRQWQRASSSLQAITKLSALPADLLEDAVVNRLPSSCWIAAGSGLVARPIDHPRPSSLQAKSPAAGHQRSGRSCAGMPFAVNPICEEAAAERRCGRPRLRVCSYAQQQHIASRRSGRPRRVWNMAACGTLVQNSLTRRSSSAASPVARVCSIASGVMPGQQSARPRRGQSWANGGNQDPPR